MHSVQYKVDFSGHDRGERNKTQVSPGQAVW